MGGWERTAVNGLVVLVESDEGGAPWVILHRYVGIERSARKVCKNHQSKRCKTNPPK